MLENILGWLTLIIILSVILFKTKDYDVLKFLLTAFFLRAFLVILDHYYFSLPGGTLDAKGFVVQAQKISEAHGLTILLNMFQSDSFFISRIISIFFTLTDKSEMMAQGISVALGTASVYLVYRLSLLLWNKDAAIKAAWIMSLHPSMVLFSALVLKEAYVTFFLLLTLMPTILLIRKQIDTKEIKFKNRINYLLNNTPILVLLIITGFFILKNIHGGIFIGFFIIIFFLLFHFIQREFNNLKRGRLSYGILLILIILATLFFLWFFQILKIPYIPGPGRILNLYDILLRRFNVGTISLINGVYGSNFPLWTVPNNVIDFFPKILTRIFYFSYSPFPWDIKRYEHLFGLADLLIMIYLTVKAWENRKLIWENPMTKFLLILLVVYLIIYGLGTNNFGTSIRHKTKFIFILICLAGPKLLNLRHSYNK